MEIIRLAGDEDWLYEATKEVSKYWKHKRERTAAPDGSYSGERRKSFT